MGNQQREQELFEAKMAKRAHMLCRRLTAMNRQFEEANPQRQTSLKRDSRREPWRDKPRQLREEAKPKDPFIKSTESGQSLRPTRSFKSQGVTKAATQKQEVIQIIDDLFQSYTEKFISCITHLSLPKGIDAGSKEKCEELLADNDLNKVEEHKQKEEEPNEITCENKLVSSSNSFEGTGKDKRVFIFKPLVRKFIYKETLMSFTNLAPVLPSEIPCHFQDFRSVVQREKSSDLLLPICHIEHPISFDPEATIETIACDVQGKEIVVPNATIQRYEFLFVPKLKLLEFTFIKMLYDSDYNFGNVIKSCEELERKKFFRHGGFLFDKTHEPINDVLITFDKFSNNPNASQLAESFFGEIVYYDNVLVFRKHLDDHAETLKFNIDDLSKKLFVGHNKYIFCIYNFLFRAFESAQDI